MTHYAVWSDDMASDALQQWDLALQQRHQRSLASLLDVHGSPIFEAGLISLAYHSVAVNSDGNNGSADQTRDSTGYVTVAETALPMYLAMAPLVASRCALNLGKVYLLIEEFDVLEDVLVGNGTVSEARGHAMARTLRRHTLACSEQCRRDAVQAEQNHPSRLSGALLHDLKTQLQSALLHLELHTADTSARAQSTEALDQIHQSLEGAIALLRDDPVH